jgi:acyl dehydratase
MTAPTVFFDATGLGEWTDEERFEVTAERIAEYAAAINDPIERHRQGEIAPPVFAIVPTFLSLGPAALAVAPVELLMKLVHGKQDFHFHRPIYPGDVLVSKAKPVGFAGGTNGSTVTVYTETRTEQGELVNEQWMMAFFRNVDAGNLVGDIAPSHAVEPVGEPVAVVTQHIDDDQTYRYSPAAGDPMPIHLDDEIATMAGLPGIINHGLCTLAFTSWAALTELADSRVERLRRLAVRFAKPVLPGQDITTRFWGNGVFETIVDGEQVLKEGLVVLSD